jgi:hypothetical protein
MAYNKKYNTSNPNKTRFFTSEEIGEIKNLIFIYYSHKFPNAILNQTEGNYLDLVEDINSTYSENILTTRFIRDLYNDFTTGKKKNIKRVEIIRDFIISIMHNENIPFLNLDVITTKDNYEEIFISKNKNESDLTNSSGIYVRKFYYRRTISDELDQFLTSDEILFILTGEAGIGKTSTLLNFQYENNGQTLIYYFNCFHHANESIIEILRSVINIKINSSANNFSELLLNLENQLYKRIVFIFDSVEHLISFNSQFFKLLKEYLVNYYNKSNLRYIKIIISANKSFLTETIPNHFENETFDINNNIFCISKDNLLFFEIDRFSLNEVNGNCELRDVYNLYRGNKEIQINSKLIGISPLTEYEFLSESVKRFISHPLTLKEFLIVSHNKEIPNEISIFKSYNKILSNLLNRIPNLTKTQINEINIILSSLADYIYINNVKNVQFNSIQYLPEKSYEIVKLILSYTPIINEIKSDFNPFGLLTINFSSDWYFEYYLFLSSYRKLIIENDPIRSEEIISNYLIINKSLVHNYLQSLIALCQLIYFEEQDKGYKLLGIIIENIFQSDDIQNSIYFESIRINYSFNNSLVKRLFIEFYYKINCAYLILYYVEELEQKALYDEALIILQLDEYWNLFSDNRDIMLRKLLSQGLNYLYIYKIEESLITILRIEDQLSQEYQSKYNFILGRCYQFKKNYEEAISIYKKSKSEKDYYGIQCAHQLAFIEMIYSSNYIEVEKIIRNNISNNDQKSPIELNLLSKTLLATCLFRQNNFKEAQNILMEIIKQRKRTKNFTKTATALRALADLYFSKFEFLNAITIIDESIRYLENTSQHLSLSYSLDIKAQILAFHFGEIEAAIKCIDNSISNCKRIQKNEMALSWNYQTKALIFAFIDDKLKVEEYLRESSQLFNTPFQKLRESFILVLFDLLNKKAVNNIEKNSIKSLITKFNKKGIGFYPLILHFGVETQIDIIKFIPSQIEIEDLENSFIYKRIYADQ